MANFITTEESTTEFNESAIPSTTDIQTTSNFTFSNPTEGRTTGTQSSKTFTSSKDLPTTTNNLEITTVTYENLTITLANYTEKPLTFTTNLGKASTSINNGFSSSSTGINSQGTVAKRATLSAVEVAGITVGGVSIAILVFIALIFCVKRKKTLKSLNKDHQYQNGMEKVRSTTMMELDDVSKNNIYSKVPFSNNSMHVNTENHYEKIEPATASKMTTNILYDGFQPNCHNENAEQNAADPSDTSTMTVNVLYDGYQSKEHNNQNDATYEEVGDLRSSNENPEITVNVLYDDQFSKSSSSQNETEIRSAYEFAHDAKADTSLGHKIATNMTVNILYDGFQPKENIEMNNSNNKTKTIDSKNALQPDR